MNLRRYRPFVIARDRKRVFMSEFIDIYRTCRADAMETARVFAERWRMSVRGRVLAVGVVDMGEASE